LEKPLKHPRLSIKLGLVSQLLILLLLFVPGSIRAEVFSNLDLGGHVKSLNLRVESDPLADRASGWASSGRFRLDFVATMADTVDFELSGENITNYSNPPGLLPLPRDSVNRVMDLEDNYNEGEHFEGQVYVDRLNLHANLLGIDWTVGRQAIGFGRITLVSPLDVIAPFPPDALDTEVRPGVDAFRAERFFGLGGQVGAIAVFGDDSDNDSYLATFTWNLKGWDLLGLAGWLRERPMVGLGLAGSLGGLGLKGEIAGYRGKDVGDPGGDLHDYFAIGAVEAWYRFDNDIVLLVEYLYNGVGEDDPDQYLEVLNSAPIEEGMSFLLGKHYLLAGPSYEVHPLVKLEGLLIWNIEDDSLFFRPLVDISVTDNLALQIFWSFTEGKKPESIPMLAERIPRSEFGSYGEYGGLYLKYYF
jgi:hypothetical protein